MKLMRNGLVVACALVMAPVSAQAEWAGPYAGGYLTHDSGDAQDITYGSGPFDIDGTGVGVFGGYNFQYGAFVVGGELDLSLGRISGEDGDYQLPLTIDRTIAVDLRAGYDMGQVMPYVTVGLVRGSYTSDHAGANNSADFATGTLDGMSYGIGVDWKVSDRSFVRVEALRTEFDGADFDYYAGDFHTMAPTSVTSFRFGYAMRF